ncbi:OPT family oligopeptide transporter [soil metagenome]
MSEPSASNDPTESSGTDIGIDLRPLSDPAEIAARDREWLEKVYDESEPQLTLRAVLMGVVLGAVLSVSDLYIGLKIGWIFGMSITSSILAFALFSAARKVRPGIRPLSMLENNTSQTAASAAAYMATAGLVSSIPALTMLRRDGVITLPDLSPWQLVVFLLAISTLGVFVAIPLKRSMIHAEQLRFPTAIVCAATIRTMHSEGREAMVKARSLLVAGLGAAALKFIVESKLGILKKLPDFIPFFGSIRGKPLSAWSFRGNTSLLLYAAGSFIGLRVTTSLLVGAIINFAVIGPWLLDHGVLVIAPPEVASDPALFKAFRLSTEQAHALPVENAAVLYRELRAKWSVWPGTAIMMAAALTTFAFRWRTISRALAGVWTSLRRGAPKDDPIAHVEVPTSWFLIGLAICTIACVVIQRQWFDVPIFEGLISVGLAFVLSIVAARATGETNITPISALGKITQLTFGVLVPGNAAANLMTATVTAGSAAHAADLLTEVKTGYLLGGSPRKQLVAQLVGVVAGAFACVPIYLLLAKPEKLGREIAAPSAVAWASVAKLMKDGPSNLPKLALPAIGVALVLGVILALVEELAPKSWKPWVPSATGLGIALVIDANDSIALFTGAAAAYLLDRYKKELSDRYRISSASGIVAGEGLMGIAIIVMRDVLHIPPG